MVELIVAHGIDHKVGTTMIAQSIAETIAAQNCDMKIAFLALNGRDSKEYLPSTISSIDQVKDRLRCGIMEADDLLDLVSEVSGVCALGGVTNEEGKRLFLPEHSAELIKCALNAFDITVVDAGNELDNGLALGALQAKGHNVFVTTQNESALARFEKRHHFYDKLQVDINSLVINRYRTKDFYDSDFIAKRLGFGAEMVIRLEDCRLGWKAELDRKTLIHYPELSFRDDIVELVQKIDSNLINKDKRRKKRWPLFTSSTN